MGFQKTNAMRIIDNNDIFYRVLTYDNKDGKIDGISVASKINKRAEEVYKTLVLQGNSKEIYVFVIPVDKELDLKKAAKVIGEKKVDMIAVSDINKYTGYIRGGCSPIGMKKKYRTIIYRGAKNLNTMIISGGKIGIQIEISPMDLANVVDGNFEDIIK